MLEFKIKVEPAGDLLHQLGLHTLGLSQRNLKVVKHKFLTIFLCNNHQYPGYLYEGVSLMHVSWDNLPVCLYEGQIFLITNMHHLDVCMKSSRSPGSHGQPFHISHWFHTKVKPDHLVYR